MSEPKKSQYQIEPFCPGVTCLDDYSGSSFYVVEGEEEAFVIDTAMGEGNIPELIREKVTEKPLTLIVTHGHGDHVMHAGEFPCFYLSPYDREMVAQSFENIDLTKQKDLSDQQILAIKGSELLVLAVPGHTAGSVIFVDQKHKCVFTGDALGSGCGVWMQVPTGLPLSQYEASLSRLLENLKKTQVDDSYEFLGGHRAQRYQSKVSGDNPLGIPLIEDMKALCQRLLSGEIAGEEAKMTRSFGEPAYYACFGRAEMIFKKSQVK